MSVISCSSSEINLINKGVWLYFYFQIPRYCTIASKPLYSGLSSEIRDLKTIYNHLQITYALLIIMAIKLDLSDKLEASFAQFWILDLLLRWISDKDYSTTLQ